MKFEELKPGNKYLFTYKSGGQLTAEFKESNGYGITVQRFTQDVLIKKLFIMHERVEVKMESIKQIENYENIHRVELEEPTCS